MPPGSEPKAYFLTWRTYGTWLPGDQRGWVDERRNAFGTSTNRPDHRLENAARGQMRSTAIELSPRLRQAVDAAIREAAAFRGWPVLALNVRTNHVHIVIGGDDLPAKMASTLKARVTRVLRVQDLVDEKAILWARGGSHRVLWDDKSVAAAVDYVLNRQ